jgi:serine/threonine kinase PknH
MTLTGPKYPTSTYDDSAKMADKACLPLMSPAQSEAYSGSGFRALSGQELNDAPPGGKFTHRVTQVVVLFPSARDADAFFTASAQRWPACSNRQFNFASMAGKPAEVWTAGPVSNTNGALSDTLTIGGGDASWTWDWATCQRALTVANNVAIDVRACSGNRSDSQSDAGVNIARQIAANVPT